MSTIRDIMIFTLLLVLVISGCGQSYNSPQPIPYDPPLVLPPPLTPAQLMDNFQTVHSEMDISNYRNMLDDRFLFFFNSGGDFWTREEDLISTDNMFSGEPRINSDGEPIKAISEIAVDHMMILESWDDVDPAHPFFGSIPGVMHSLYQVRIVLYHSGGTITIETNQIFYAAPTTTDGVTLWALIGQEDDSGKAAETSSWSNIKSMFR